MSLPDKLAATIRLTTHKNGQHHITIPNHRPLKIGTLNAILSEVAQHLGISKENVLDKKQTASQCLQPLTTVKRPIGFRFFV